MTVTLYTAPISHFGHRVSLALAASGIPFEIVNVDLKNRPAWFTELARDGQIPVLKLGPHADKDAPVIPESLAITQYIADKSGRLLPADPFLRAQVNVFTRRFEDKVRTAYLALASAPAGLEREEKLATFKAGLAYIEAFLTRLSPAGPYVLGEEYSLADVNSIPFIARYSILLPQFRGFSFDEAEYPRIVRWLNACKSRPEWDGLIPSNEEIIRAFTPWIVA